MVEERVMPSIVTVSTEGPVLQQVTLAARQAI
jgi:hypothetical protein